MSLKPYDVQTISRDVSEIYSEMESAVIDSIVYAVKSGNEKKVDRYWLTKLNDAGQVTQGLITKVKRASGATTKEIRDVIFNAMAYGNELDRDAVYKATAKPVAKAKLNETLFENIREMEEVAKTTLNMTANALVSSGSEAYRHLIGKAYVKASTGAVPLAKAVDMAIEELGEDGLYITYESGYRCSVDSAIRRDIVTNINRQVGNQTISNCDYLGYDLVETSYHAGARPEHAVWQGKIFSLSGKSDKYPSFKEATRWGEVDGICGINCRHSFYPHPEEGDEIDKSAMPTPEENAIKYKNEQTARAYERSLRQMKRIVHTREVAGMDTAQQKNEFAKLSKAYRKFCDEHDIARQTFRYSAGGKLNLYEDASLDKLRSEYEAWLKKTPKQNEPKEQKEKGAPKERIEEGEKPTSKKTEEVEVKSRIAEKPWEVVSKKKTKLHVYNTNDYRGDQVIRRMALKADSYYSTLKREGFKVLDLDKFNANKMWLPAGDKDNGDWVLVEASDGSWFFMSDTHKIAFNKDICESVATWLDDKDKADFRAGNAFMWETRYIGSKTREDKDVGVFQNMTTSDLEKLKEGGGLQIWDVYKRSGVDDYAYDNIKGIMKDINKRGYLDTLLGNGNADKFEIYCINYKESTKIEGLSMGWKPSSDIIFIDKETGEIYDYNDLKYNTRIFETDKSAQAKGLTDYMKSNMEYVYGGRKSWDKDKHYITVNNGNGFEQLELSYKEMLELGSDNIIKQSATNENVAITRNYLEKAISCVEYSAKEKGRTAYYSLSEDSLMFGSEHMGYEFDRGKNVPFHEMGHYADGHITSNGEWSYKETTDYSMTYSNQKWGDKALSNALEQDGRNFNRDAFNKALSAIDTLQQEGRIDKTDSIEMKTSLKDMAQANAHIPYGTHGTYYFEGARGREMATTEFFAEMTSISATDSAKEIFEIFREVFPNGVEVWEEMIRNIKI